MSEQWREWQAIHDESPKTEARLEEQGQARSSSQKHEGRYEVRVSLRYHLCVYSMLTFHVCTTARFC